jgi:hypothetical protein
VSGREPWCAALRVAWNFVQANLHRSYPCGRCGYRYDCPDGECHS